MNQTLFMLILEHWKCGKGVQLFNATDEQSNTSGIVIAEVELGNDFASGKN